MSFPLPWSNQASLKSSISPPSVSNSSLPSNSRSYGTSVFSLPSSYTSSSSSAASDLTNITPQKSSVPFTHPMDNACAFPSWPNRPSLINTDPERSTKSAFVSDEELLSLPPPPKEFTPAAPTVSVHATTPAIPVSFNNEQEARKLRVDIQEERHRARFLAQVQAHARAQQALRTSQPEKQKKRRTVSAGGKRRTISSPSKARS